MDAFQTCSSCGSTYHISLATCPHCGQVSSKQELQNHTTQGTFTSERIDNKHDDSCKFSDLPKTQVDYKYDSHPLFTNNTNMYNDNPMFASFFTQPNTQAFPTGSRQYQVPIGQFMGSHQYQFPRKPNYGPQSYSAPSFPQNYFNVNSSQGTEVPMQSNDCPLKNTYYQFTQGTFSSDRTKVFNNIVEAVCASETEVGECVTMRSGKKFVIRKKGMDGYADPL